jgi:hypothetical protein
MKTYFYFSELTLDFPFAILYIPKPVRGDKITISNVAYVVNSVAIEISANAERKCKVYVSPVKEEKTLDEKDEINPISGLTYREQDCMDSLTKAVKEWSALTREHPDEMKEFIDAIHRAQDLLAVRIARREYPKGWFNMNNPEALLRENKDA